MPKSPQESYDKILNFIITYYKKYGVSPTIREITEGVGLKSTATVHHHITELERQGMLMKIPEVSRGIVINPEYIPVETYYDRFVALVKASEKSPQAFDELCLYMAKMQRKEPMDVDEWADHFRLML